MGAEVLGVGEDSLKACGLGFGGEGDAEFGVEVFDPIVGGDVGSECVVDVVPGGFFFIGEFDVAFEDVFLCVGGEFDAYVVEDFVCGECLLVGVPLYGCGGRGGECVEVVDP